MTITCVDGLVNGTTSIAASFKESKDSDEQVSVILDVQLVNVPLQDVVGTALRDVRIAFVNNVGRPNFASYKSGQHVAVDFSSPGKKPVDNKAAIIKGLVASGVSIDEATKLADAIAANPAIVANLLK